ncbi:alanine racemase [Nocardioides perillae]|uniref:Alanine racemase n=1 Tax=Nocardioides perillae TaxID=1119534 RepID=A0A7Y9ULW7_9ACTN|nr:alanine racemase [Nocardioides perillae]
MSPALPPPHPPAAPGVRAEVVVDLAAVRHNVRLLRAAAGSAALMTVVKADAYGHGLLAVAAAAREAGAAWLGVATVEEALALRAAGDDGPLLCWLAAPGQDYDGAVAAGVDVTAYTPAEVREVAAAARRTGVPARLQLKVDTGLSRGGATLPEWDALVAAAREARGAGEVVVTGTWSHLAAADEPDHPATGSQQGVFAAALSRARVLGLAPGLRHLANSAGTLLHPDTRLDLVRCGVATYGRHPAPEVAGPDTGPDTGPGAGLVPVMTVQGRLALTKRIRAGASVSYGHTWTAERDTTVGLVPLGYADGVPRHASSPGAGGHPAEVWVAGRRRPVVGRVCMDQLVVDLGGEELPAGTPYELFGTGHDGAPTALDWARAAGTIDYEVLTRVGGAAGADGRLARRWVDTGWDRTSREDDA